MVSGEEKAEAENSGSADGQERWGWGWGCSWDGLLQQEQSSRRVAAMVMGRRVKVPGCTESPAPVGDVVLAELL